MIPFFEFISFQIGPIAFYTWGSFVALGYICGLLLSRFLARKQGISESVVFSLFLWVFVASMVGARLLYVILFWDIYAEQPSRIFNVQDGGLVMLGGFVCGILATVYVAKKHGLRVWALADISAPALAAGLAIGRIGCFLINDQPGARIAQTSAAAAWAIQWPDGALRHPVALYLIIWNAAVCVFLMWISRRQIKCAVVGLTTWSFLGLYGLGRLVLDSTRATDVLYADPRWLYLTVSQWAGLGLVVVTTIWMMKHRHAIANVFTTKR